MLEDWKRGNFDKSISGSLLTSAAFLGYVEDLSLNEDVKRKAIARLLGLVPFIEVSASADGANALDVDIAVNVTHWANFGENRYTTTTTVTPPPEWSIVGDAKPQRSTADVGVAIEQQLIMRRSGKLQTAVLRGELKVELPDTKPIDYPFSETLLPSINRWHLIGPFDAPMEDRLAHVFEPEQAIDLDASYVGKEKKKIRWQQIERPITADSDLTDEFFVEFYKYFDGIKYETVAYALVYLHAPRDMDASLSFGSDDGIAIWLNDLEVYRNDVGRAYTPKEDRCPIKLKKGSNKLLVKISQGVGMWGFGMHVESPDGDPIPEVTVSLEP